MDLSKSLETKLKYLEETHSLHCISVSSGQSSSQISGSSSIIYNNFRVVKYVSKGFFHHSLEINHYRKLMMK